MHYLDVGWLQVFNNISTWWKWFGIKQGEESSIKYYKVDLSVYVIQVSLYTTTLGPYDMIIGMDWLESHEVVLDCKGMLLFYRWLRTQKNLVVTKRGVSLSFILML